MKPYILLLMPGSPDQDNALPVKMDESYFGKTAGDLIKLSIDDALAGTNRKKQSVAGLLKNESAKAYGLTANGASIDSLTKITRDMFEEKVFGEGATKATYLGLNIIVAGNQEGGFTYRL